MYTYFFCGQRKKREEAINSFFEFNLSGFNSPPLAVKYVKLFLKPDTPLLAAGSLHYNL